MDKFRINKVKGFRGQMFYIKDTFDGATTDIEGKFSFTSAETGQQILVVSFIGFEASDKKKATVLKPLDIANDGLGEFKCSKLNRIKYKERFVIKVGDHLRSLMATDAQVFYSHVSSHIPEHWLALNFNFGLK